MDCETWKTLVCNLRGDSRVRPSQVMLSEKWITRVTRSDGRGTWRQSVARLIHQTVPLSNITVLYLCQDIFSPGKYAISLKNSRDQLGRGIYCFKLFPLADKTWYRCSWKWPNDRLGTWSWIDIPPVMTGDAYLGHLLMHEGYPP